MGFLKSGSSMAALTEVDSNLVLGPQAYKILRGMLILTSTAGTASTLYGVIQYGFVWANVGGAILAVIALIAFLLQHFGYPRLGIQVLVWSATATILILCLFVAGVRTPALLFMPVLCSLAIWLAGLRTGFALFAVASSFALALVVAESFGYVPPNAPRTSLGVVMVLVPTIAAALLISAGALESFRAKIDLVLQLTRNQEEQLHALRKSEERFAAMFRANPLPSGTIDRSGKLLDVNQAWTKTFGLTREQAVGHTYESLGLWNDPAAMAAGVVSLQTRGSIDGLLTRMRAADGELRPFLVFVSAVEFDGERRFVSSLLDQTDRIAVEDAQRAQTLALEERVRERTAELSRTVADLGAAQSELVRSEKLASLGSMVAGISHELNTPIGNTLTVATSLQELTTRFEQKVQANQLRRSELAEFVAQSREMSDLIARSTQRAAELISSFKQVAVDVSSQRRREFELSEVVDDVLISLKPGMRHKNIALHVDIPQPILCDSLPGAVEQVLTNLVQNAVLHGLDERASGNITIAAHSNGTTVTVTVSDDGAGMDEATLQHAFDPFFTTRLGKGGSGLGLSVSHSLAVSALRGDMHAESSPGQGTRVTLRFMQHLD